MNPALMLALFSVPPPAPGGPMSPTTVSFTSNTPWIAPDGVVLLTSMSGKGADGTAGTPGYFGPATVRGADKIRILGNAISNSPYGFSDYPGILDWAVFQSEDTNLAALMNSGGSGSFASYYYEQYQTNYHLTSSSIAYHNVVPGSATAVRTNTWKTSGAVGGGDSGSSGVTWQEADSIPGTPGTNGDQSYGCGRGFPGGTPTATAAAMTYYNNVTVTPGTTYYITVPAGGVVTITY